MTHPTSPEMLNRRLGNYEYITSHADLAFFDDLIVRIRRMEQPGDKFQIPSKYEPRAWAKAYLIYERLAERDATPPDPAKQERVVSYAAIEASWNQYLSDRMMLLEYDRRGELNNNACLYLGLLPGDLGPAISQHPDDSRFGGRPRDWVEKAQRISNALSRWNEMGMPEKMAIPQIMAARRAEAAASRNEAAIRDLSERTSTLEKKETAA